MRTRNRKKIKIIFIQNQKISTIIKYKFNQEYFFQKHYFPTLMWSGQHTSILGCKLLFYWECKVGIDNLLVLLIGGIPIAMPTILSVTMAIGSHRLSQQARAGITEVHFLPFNPTDKRTALTYIDKAGTMHRVSKGAPEQILDLAHNKSNIEKRVHLVIDNFAECGLRSLGVARQLNAWVKTTYFLKKTLVLFNRVIVSSYEARS
ncbi:hypothetical protein DCAR_0101921 [Daucus carota subsp. sativus]|uniref:Uncharacterized protein n=1 Tax=Daucus carota subsp. sativus TaxID=79200 RepID=A0AAF1AHC4_DAUCS|nr:hypothetical protein DCAR_0101921 [Daucus carota subsp. sativus]